MPLPSTPTTAPITNRRLALWILILALCPAALVAQTLDPSYGWNGIATVHTAADDLARDALEDRQGRLLLAGSFEDGAAVVRLQPDGSLDPHFGNGGMQTQILLDTSGGLRLGYLTAVALDAQERIVVGGAVAKNAATTSDLDLVIARLEAAGQLDGSFGSGGIVEIALDLGGQKLDRVDDVTVVGDEIFVLATVELSAADSDLFLFKLQPDGQTDLNFNYGLGYRQIYFDYSPSTMLDTGVALAFDAHSGRLLIAGTADNYARTGVVALWLDGSTDTTFGTNGRQIFMIGQSQSGVQDGGASAFDVAANGDLLVAGTVTDALFQESFGITKLLANGQFDTSFASSGHGIFSCQQLQCSIYSLTVDYWDRVLAAGERFTGWPNGSELTLLRVLGSGSIDTSFGNGGWYSVQGQGFANAQATASTLQSDGKVVVAGRPGQVPADVLSLRVLP